jgi:2-phospho-L-lactate transferase/gluconeogenesis factor (CofD/UPF0052 family)
MNIVVLSGGSGNDSLIKGIKSLYPEASVKVIVNAYDNGKSTGVCRAVTNTLGVSDIRKNHSRMYEVTAENVDMRIKEFYDGRYNFTPGREAEEIKVKLDQWGLSNLSVYVDGFFSNQKSREYVYKDFSVANIVYSQMYKVIGYEETNKYFCNLLGLDDFVILNSFDNVFINAVTERGVVIKDEGEIVCYNNANDKIIKMFYTGDSCGRINEKAIDAVKDADLIIISTGTFWSSIYPTLEYGDFYKYINDSSAKKVWAMNCEYDGDSVGVTSVEFVAHFVHLGLDLSKFTVLLNYDANPDLALRSNCVKCVGEHMGNNNGKHDGDKYAKAIFRAYYGIDTPSSYDRILFDFDDTIWARGGSDDKVSVDNIRLLNSNLADKVTIVSGNSYDSIARKLYRVFGTDLHNFNIDIWADANSILYRNNKCVAFVDEFSIEKSYKKISEYLRSEFDIDSTINNYEMPSCLKIRPIVGRERIILASHLNSIFKSIGVDDCVAKITGKSTIDIVSVNNTKGKIYSTQYDKESKILYVGDEIGSGNDTEIASLCTGFISTSGVTETNMLIRLLICE